MFSPIESDTETQSCLSCLVGQLRSFFWDLFPHIGNFKLEMALVLILLHWLRNIKPVEGVLCPFLLVSFHSNQNAIKKILSDV